MASATIVTATPMPVHAERTLASSPPPYFSPTAARPTTTPTPAPAPAPTPAIELRLDTTPSPPRSNRSSWANSGGATGTGSGTESDITSGILSPNAGMVHVPLNSPGPHSAHGVVVKSAAQRLRGDPIAMLLYLRRAVTVTKQETAKNAQRPCARRHSTVSSTSSSSTAVGEEDEKVKERDLAEPWSAAPTASYREQLPVEVRRDIEAQKNAEMLSRRRPIIIALIVLLVLLVVSGTTLGVYLGVRNGFH